MEKYKSQFIINFGKSLQANVLKWKQIQKDSIKSLYSINSLMAYFLLPLIGLIPAKRETLSNYHWDMHGIFYLLIFLLVIYINISVTNKNFQLSIKKILFPELLRVFGYIYYGENTYLKELFLETENENITDDYIKNLILKYNNETYDVNLNNATFEQSKLFTHKITERLDDDIVFGEYNDVKFTMVETDFGWNAKNKNRTYNRMFKGIALHFKLNKKITSRVIITTKFTLTKIPENYEKVIVEYEKFNKKYNVWAEKGTNGQIEARYLLNTAFIDRFMQIQTSFRVNEMNCSICDDSLLIMLCTGKDLFEMNYLFGKVDDVNQYKHLFEEFASVFSFIDILKLSDKTGL